MDEAREQQNENCEDVVDQTVAPGETVHGFFFVWMTKLNRRLSVEAGIVQYRVRQKKTENRAIGFQFIFFLLRAWQRRVPEKTHLQFLR